MSAKQLLAQRHLPHYIQFRTRKSVLHVYKSLITAASKLQDPLCRKYTREYIYERFMAFKYVAKVPRINALVSIAKNEVEILEAATKKSNSQAQLNIMRRVFQNVNNCEQPLSRLVGHRIDHSILEYKIHHIQVPDIETFQQFDEAARKADILYFKYIRALQQNGIVRGFNERKLFFKVPREATLLGEPLPLSRERNLVRRSIAKTIADMPLPTHHSIVDYLKRQLAKPEGLKYSDYKSVRSYKRRVKDIIDSCFTVSEDADGHLKIKHHKVNALSSGKSYWSID